MPSLHFKYEVGDHSRRGRYRGEPTQRAKRPMRGEVAHGFALRTEQHEQHEDRRHGHAVDHRAPVERAHRVDG